MSRIVLFFGCDKTWLELGRSGFHRRNTHLLRVLSQQEGVSHVLNVRYISRGAFISRRETPSATSDSVTDVFVTNYLPGPKFLVERVNRFISRARLMSKLRRFGSNQPPLSWCYLSNSFWQFESHWNQGTLILDLDHNQVDAIHAPSEARLTAIESAARRATVTISSSRSMNHWILSRSLGPCELIFNGIDPNRFQAINEANKQNQLQVGYVGSLSKWIDYDAFENIIRSNPDARFLVAGKPYGSEKWTALAKLQNVEFIGFLTPHEVPQFLAQLDMTLNLYQRLPGLDVNSMKIYESLACHVPVASLDYHDHLHTDFQGLVKTYANATELGQSLREVAALGRDPVWREEVDAFLEASTWERRVAQCLNSVADD